MSINLSPGINPEKTKNLGKFFHTLDFEFNDSFAQNDYLNRNSKIPVGHFFIGKSKFEISIAEMERIIETMEAAKDTLYKKYKLGRMASR